MGESCGGQINALEAAVEFEVREAVLDEMDVDLEAHFVRDRHDGAAAVLTRSLRSAMITVFRWPHLRCAVYRCALFRV